MGSDPWEADPDLEAHGEAVTSPHPRSQLAEICADYTDMIPFSWRFSESHIHFAVKGAPMCLLTGSEGRPVACWLFSTPSLLPRTCWV